MGTEVTDRRMPPIVSCSTSGATTLITRVGLDIFFALPGMDYLTLFTLLEYLK